MEFWGQSNAATIGFLRQAEIKHGRVAMAGFVGYCVQANGITFPWDLTGNGISFADIGAAGGPSDQWDALPTSSKLQIIGFVGFLEWWSENKYALSQSGQTHYMRGGKPGFFPSFNKGGIPHPVPLELFDPFNLQGKMSPEKKETSLLAEINNGERPQRRRNAELQFPFSVLRHSPFCLSSLSPCRPPRDDRHDGPHLRVEGPHRPGYGWHRRPHIRWRADGALNRR